MAVFVALPLPFISPTTAGLAGLSGWSGVPGWLLGLHEQNLQVFIALLAGLTLGAYLGGLSQVLYIGLGLSGLAAFTQGGGWSYWQQPTMGYLLALIPAASVTAWIAGRSLSCSRLLMACCCGLTVLQLLGLSYITWTAWSGDYLTRWQEVVTAYVFVPLPGQLLQALAVAIVVWAGRHTLARLAMLLPNRQLIGVKI